MKKHSILLPFFISIFISLPACFKTRDNTKNNTTREEDELESLESNPAAIKEQIKVSLSSDLNHLNQLTYKLKTDRKSGKTNSDLEAKVKDYYLDVSKDLRNLNAAGYGGLLDSTLTAQKIYFLGIIQSEIDRYSKASKNLDKDLKILNDTKHKIAKIDKSFGMVKLPKPIAESGITQNLNRQKGEIDHAKKALSKRLEKINNGNRGLIAAKTVTEKIKSDFEQEMSGKIKVIKNQLIHTPNSVKKNELVKTLNSLETLVAQSKTMSVYDWKTLREDIIGNWKNTENKFISVYSSKKGLPSNVYFSEIITYKKSG